MGKTLLIENQIALLLKDIYDFTVPEIGEILNKTEGVIKYLLQDARKTMTDMMSDTDDNLSLRNFYLKSVVLSPITFFQT
jgi:DNA-directed RNA polymerase specialized sigma24 family protein